MGLLSKRVLSYGWIWAGMGGYGCLPGWLSLHSGFIGKGKAKNSFLGGFMGGYWCIWEDMGEYGRVWVDMGGYISTHIHPHPPISIHSGLIWVDIGWYGWILVDMGGYGRVWADMGAYLAGSVSTQGL